MTDLWTAPVVEEVEEGDHERFKHIVIEGWHPHDETKEFVPVNNSVVEGAIFGTPVQALCGKVWVPSLDTSRFPLCPTCEEIAKEQGWKIPA